MEYQAEPKTLKISTIYFKNWSQDTNLRKSGDMVRIQKEVKCQ